jgi:hypothetical protein
MTGFAEDSFFTLSLMERIGLLSLSLVLSAICIVLVYLIPYWRPLRVFIAVVVFYLFVWLSPQLYYLYYIMIFDGLPWQMVVRMPPLLSDLFAVVFFVQSENLAKVSQAILFWLMIFAAIARRQTKA